MIQHLRQALKHVESVSESEQETLAQIIDDMWETAQLPPFNPADVPQEQDDFVADMEEIARIHGKVSQPLK